MRQVRSKVWNTEEDESEKSSENGQRLEAIKERMALKPKVERIQRWKQQK